MTKHNFKPLISVIIPVYNTPVSFLASCISSIESQKFTDFEVILVNDGSTSELAKSYTALSKEHGFILINKENGGVSSARNLGIQKASGTYITFIDSDDIITDAFFKEAAAYAGSGDYDIIIGSMKDSGRKTSTPLTNDITVLGAFDISDLTLGLMGAQGQRLICNQEAFHLLGSPCGRLYKSSLIRDISFDESLKYSEDQLFNRTVFAMAKSAVVTPSFWYEYRQNSFSAMHGGFDRYLQNISVFWDKWADLNNHESNDHIRKAADILSLRWYNGVTAQWIVPLESSLSSKIDIMKKIYSFKLFSSSVSDLQYKDIAESRLKLSLFLMKHHLFVITLLINYINVRLQKGKRQDL